jgi:hypothetical protein
MEPLVEPDVEVGMVVVEVVVVVELDWQ